MDFRPLLLVLALFAGSVAFAQAYRWVDADGVVHYSDRPPPETASGAEEVVLPTANQTRFATRALPSRSRSADDDSNSSSIYSSISITSPSAEETLWNIEATLQVSVALSPALKPGHKLRVYFDGQPQTFPMSSFTLDEVYRGTHNLQVEVLDNNGQMLIRSEPIRFYVQQNSIIPRPGAS